MSDVALPSSQAGTLTGPVVSGRDLAPWAILAGAVMLVLLYFIGAEEGATSVIAGTSVHEFVHDARHLLGFPCH
jgi:hypothetical protein